MGAATDQSPKCMTQFRGKALLDWQISSLLEGGVSEVAVVRGYLGDSFKASVQYFENPRWHESNMVVSALSAEEWLSASSCIISYSDIVYSPEVVARLVETENDIAISYDPDWRSLWELRFENPLDDAETFKLDSSNMLVEIGSRATSVGEIEGQFMGLIKNLSTRLADCQRLFGRINQC